MTHGTDAGYQAHYKKGGDRKPCEPCREAHRKRMEARRTPSQHTLSLRTRGEDLAWMATTGEHAVGAAQRLGLSYSTLDQWARRNTPDVWAQLVRRNPRDINADTFNRDYWGAA